MTTSTKRTVQLTAVVALLGSAPALSQVAEDSLQLERYRVPVDSSGLGTTAGGEIPEHLEFSAGFIGHYELNPLVFESPDGARQNAIVAHRLAGSVVGTVGLFDVVSFGVEAPLVFFQMPGTENDPTLREVLGLAGGLSSFGLGDLKIVPKVRILRLDKHYVSLAIAPTFSLPTAAGLKVAEGIGFDYGQSYLGEGPLTFSFLPELILSTTQWGVRAAMNLQYRLRPPALYLGAVPIGPDFTYRFGLGVDAGWWTNWLLQRFLEGDQKKSITFWTKEFFSSFMIYAEIFGATGDRNPFGLIPAGDLTPTEEAIHAQQVRLENSLEWASGVRWNIWRGIQAELGIGTGLRFLTFRGYGSPDLRVTGGLRYAYQRRDKDRDGIDDDDDACPDEPEDIDGVGDSDGCPDPDNDGDQLPDLADACPDSPEDYDGFEDGDGCPEPDNDADAVPDAEDECPNEKGPVDNRGCPIRDRDKDGVADGADKCPDVPGPPAREGCPVSDRDGDGVPDETDRCPDEQGPADRGGCPPRDRDADGVQDADDTCPDVPGPVERQGCPLNDRDLDGVLDSEDNCPDEKGPANRKGCPIPDEDGDGIEDKVDACPKEAGPPVLKGCPDRDGDGVADREDQCPDKVGIAIFQGCDDEDNDGIPSQTDKCPTEPETINGVDDTDGCPDQGKVLVIVTKKKIEIRDKVYFASGRSTIKRRSYSLLDQVAQVLQANQQITKVEIQGHTDSQGSDRANKRLSDKRAAAVVVYLINKGVDPARLSSVGYGEEQPIDDNGTADGRANNRRVEFVILEQK